MTKFKVGDKVTFTRQLLTEVKTGNKIEFVKPLRKVRVSCVIDDVDGVTWDGDKLYGVKIGKQTWSTAAWGKQLRRRT